jgi:hypothetical protein
MDYERERKVDRVLSQVAKGDLTFDRLKRAVADGKAQVKSLGPRIEPTTLDALAAGEEAVERIEREQSRLDQINL